MINPLFLILQSISGGVAGYITNKYAVNMLFKEYTPLKLGGVVKKNKEKFIDEISTLVEKDIINGKTLKEHIHGEEFKKQLDITVEEFWNSGLKEVFNDVKIKDISSFEESKESILEFTEVKMKLVSDKLLKNIVDNVKITEILSAKHISYITDIVYEEAFKYIQSEHKISVLLTDIYHQNNSLIIKDIIDEATERKIKANIEEFIINSLEKILTDKEKLSNMMGKIYDVINIDEIINKDDCLIVMLDHIVDPHNFGAIIRTCEAAGITGIIIPKDRSVEVNSTVMKTSAGAVENVKIAQVVNIADVLDELKENGFWVVGTKMESDTDYRDIDYTGKVALVIGNEGNGMSNLVSKKCDYIAKIPMYGKVNSLNASVAAGIMIYEMISLDR